MAKFRNNETGNVLNVKNEKTIELMEKSKCYTRVQEITKTKEKNVNTKTK